MIRKSFKKCSITCVLDGNEDNLFQMFDGKKEASSVEDGEFEGFSQAGIKISNEVYQNIKCVFSDESCSSDSETAMCVDTVYDRPRHKICVL